MTGFARHQGEQDGTSWIWEIRAVNGKGLDMRLRLPNGYDAYDSAIRKACGARLSRGNLQINLSVDSANSQPLPQVNPAVLEAVHDAMLKATEVTGAAMPNAAEVLSVRGVLEFKDQGEKEGLSQADILRGLQETLDSLIEHREAEGGELYAILSAKIDEIDRLCDQAINDPQRSEDAIRERINTQIARLGDVGSVVEPDRLAAEVALLATKADIAEELDRLSAHIKSARNLLNEGSPVGRKLEFLAQEFNREANTLCSKSNAVSITETGLALKVVIDQFREQVLNVE